MVPHEIVLRGGRVIDPESGLDAIRDVAIDGPTVTELTEGQGEGTSVIDVSGLVVAPGFIDLHSHAQTLAGRRLQACDGVTTPLDQEAGRSPVQDAYAREVALGSPINYGFSASWALARAQALTGRAPDGGMEGALSVLGDATWRGPATAEQFSQILRHLSGDLAQGAIGIGVLLGYAPDVDAQEYVEVARLAANCGTPTFTHCRDLVELAPGTKVDGAEELVHAAAETGAHMHYCHVNSSTGRHFDRVLGLIERCRAAGGRVTTEAYPYGASATAIGAPFLAPERLHERQLAATSLRYLATGERVADDARLRQLRAADPDALVIIDFLNEDDPADLAALRRCLTAEDTMVASDAMPLVPVSDQFDPRQWPLGPGAVTHPRSAGCFSRALRLWREEGRPLSEAIRRCSLLPARALEASCPSMRARGRVQRGAAADLVIFDADRVTDQATYADSTRLSAGVRHVLVDGVFVVRDGDLVVGALPGRPIRAGTV
jgi:dihydroorotase-like cyclic amidohydrolase